MPIQTIYNVHTHIFNDEYIPNGILGNDAFGANDLLARNLVNTLIQEIKEVRSEKKVNEILRLASALITLLNKFLDEDKEISIEVIQRAKKIVHSVLIGGQLQLYKELLEAYDNEGLPETRFVILCQCMDYQSNKNGDYKRLPKQLEEISELRKDPAIRRRMIPFIGIDPRMFRDPEIGNNSSEGILNFLKFWITKTDENGNHIGGYGVKLYPSAGFYFNSEKLRPIYEYCIEHNLPILTHFVIGVIHYQKAISGKKQNKRVFYNVDHIEGQRKQKFRFQLNFTHPEWIERTLSEFNSLKVNLAHMAGTVDYELLDRIIDSMSKDWKDNMLTRFKERGRKEGYPQSFTSGPGWKKKTSTYWHAWMLWLIKEYPNVYCDVSHSMTDTNFQKRIIYYMGKSNKSRPTWMNGLENRILFGTDYYVNIKDEATEKEQWQSFKNGVGDEIFYKISGENAAEYLSSKIETFTI